MLFGEDLTGDKVLLTDAAGFAALRKDNDYIRASDLGQRMITDEIVGISIHAPVGATDRTGSNTDSAYTSIHVPRDKRSRHHEPGCAPLQISDFLHDY